MVTIISITAKDIPNQSKVVALRGSLYLRSDQAMSPPIQLRPMNAGNSGNSHQAHDVRSTATVSLCSLETGALHSGQNIAFLDILAPQAPQECKDLPQNWQ